MVPSSDIPIAIPVFSAGTSQPASHLPPTPPWLLPQPGALGRTELPPLEHVGDELMEEDMNADADLAAGIASSLAGCLRSVKPFTIIIKKACTMTATPG